MTIYKKRVDDNHAEVKLALMSAGANVDDISAIGGGVPDLLVGFVRNGQKCFAFFEVKDGKKFKSQQKLTPAQERWHEKYRGWPVCTVDSAEAALRHLKVLQT